MSETPRSDAEAGPSCYRHADRETWISCQRCSRPICPDCMREASVGFQCPDCVREGARTTRSGRTAYGGKRSANPALTSMVLIGINVAVWLAVMATGGRSGRLYPLLALDTGSCRSIASPTDYFPDVSTAAGCTSMADGGWVAGTLGGQEWQLVTSMFTHVEVWHIGFNMLALWILGPQLEAVLGRTCYLALYLLSGVAGSVAVLWLTGPLTTIAGASTAIFGLMGALLVVAFKIKANVQQILVWIGLNVAITVLGSSFISWQGHLGGFVGGLVVAGILVYAPRTRRTTWQVVGLVAVGAVLVVATVLRALA